MIKASLVGLLIFIPLTLIAFQAGAFDRGFLAYMFNDFDAALKTWKEKAKLGNATAQANIANLYENGNGVVKSNVLAHLWYSLAVINGSATAKKNKDAIEKKMTEDELNQAIELVSLCLDSKYENCGF